MLSLCKEGCLLKRTTSPSIKCRSTMSPYCRTSFKRERHRQVRIHRRGVQGRLVDRRNLTFRSLAILLLSPYLKNLQNQKCILSCSNTHTHTHTHTPRTQGYAHLLMLFARCWMKLAPGCLSGPLTTSCLMSSALAGVTLSGYVRILATCTGTPTWGEGGEDIGGVEAGMSVTAVPGQSADWGQGRLQFCLKSQPAFQKGCHGNDPASLSVSEQTLLWPSLAVKTWTGKRRGEQRETSKGGGTVSARCP